MENQSEKLTIEDIDQMNAVEYTPAIVLLTLIVIIGLTGNTFAAIFFIWKAQKSVINFFISCLSVNDALTNAVLVQEVVQLFYFLSCDDVVIYKLFFVLKHWLVGNSLLFMVAIAVDRYRRVCFPFSKQITYTVAKYIMLGLTIFSFLIASRNIATVDIEKFNITAFGNSTITGYFCTKSIKEDVAQVKTIFHVVDISLHGIIMCTFVVLNILLVRKIVQTKQKLKDHRTLELSQYHIDISIEASSTVNVHTDIDQKHDTDHDTKELPEKKHSDTIKGGPKPELHNKSISGTMKRKTGTSYRTISHVHASSIEIKITMMVVVITIISALCFVPYYVAMLTGKLDFSGSATIMTVGEVLARRSYTLNSVVNPYIMLVFNLPFRKFVLNVFRGLCVKYKKTEIHLGSCRNS